MIRPIALELAGDGGRPLGGLALLAAALLVAAALGARFALLRGEIGELTGRLEALHAAGRSRSAAAVLRVSSADVAADLKRAQLVLRELGAPWNQLFAEVERAVGADVALLDLQPERAAGRVTIAGEARNLEAALAFAERLGRGPALADAVLAAHELRVQDPQRPVRFIVNARWTSGGAP